MLNLGAQAEAPDVTKLSDAELIAQLAQQAKELGIEIDLNYSFAQPQKEPDDNRRPQRWKPGPVTKGGKCCPSPRMGQHDKSLSLI